MVRWVRYREVIFLLTLPSMKFCQPMIVLRESNDVHCTRGHWAKVYKVDLTTTKEIVQDPVAKLKVSVVVGCHP